jgi:hypothetical protein
MISVVTRKVLNQLDRYTGQPDTYVELKTSMSIRPGVVSDERSFEKYAKLARSYVIPSHLL